MDIVESHDFGAPAAYPFETWADGKTRRARQGEDFASTVDGFVTALRRWGKKNGRTVNATRETGSVVFRIT